MNDPSCPPGESEFHSITPRSLRVLIVEDSEVDAGLLVRELKQHGYTVVSQRVTEGSELEAALAAQTWDLVLSDYALPRFTGLDALRIVQRSGLDLPFILISGTIGEEVAVDAMRAGAHDYLLKDHLARLGAAVERELRDAEERHARRQAEEKARTAEIETRRMLQVAEQSRFALLSVVEDLKRTEAALRESELRFQQVTEHMGEWIWEVDAQGLYTYASPVVQKILGYRPDEIVGKLHYFDLFAPERHASLKQAALDHFNAKRPFVRFRNYCIHRNGHPVLIETNGTPLLDGEGALLGYRGVDSDITERERAEDQIRAQAELLDLAQDAILVWDINGRVQYWNKGCQRLLDYALAESIDASVLELLKPERSVYERAMRTLLEEGRWSGEYMLVTKNQRTVSLMSRWTLVRDEQDQPQSVLAIHTDITERKKLEIQFFRAQRLEGIGSLASGIAHDLNNILAPILMTAPLLHEVVNDSENRALIETIETCAKRGADIIKQLLTFARGHPDARVPLPVRHLLSELGKIIRETFPRNIQPRVEVPTDLWPILGDATQIHQALLNMCINSRDAMPNGGLLTLAARNVTMDDTLAGMIPDAKPGPYVCVSVTDTGAGIPPEHLDRIFDPFFTTKEIGKGTGLGLATVLGIVRGHNGFLQVNSQVDRGTAFELYFPASLDAKVKEAISVPMPPEGQGELILVVDDEAGVRNCLRRMLEKRGYRVLTSFDGAEGIVTFSKHRSDIQAVLTDMMMPVINGPEMIAALRRLEPQLIILGMTGLQERTGLKGLDNKDLAALLIKPFSGDELLRALHAALHPSGTTNAQELTP